MINIDFILIVVVQVVCVFIFLTFFFFEYASKKEAEIIENQVDFITKDFLGTNIQLLPEELKQILLTKVNTLKADTSMNEKIIKSNNEIKDKTYKIIFGLSISVIGFVLICYLLSFKFPYFKMNLYHIFKETLIILFFVAVTEFLFLEYFAARYVSVQPNLIKSKIFKNLSLSYQS